MTAVVINKDGKMACKGWRGAPGSGFTWQYAGEGVDGALPDYVWQWPTEDGARAFADMNGGRAVDISKLRLEP